ncbi:MAG TPA: hypothetical protein VNJ01_15560 [Bacteriovoracaceae bacterium]|nr:hypothetical protein [Bacteriovoracaceae bacterium]
MSNKTISNTLYHFTGFGGGKGKETNATFETLKAILDSSMLRLSRNEIARGHHDSDGKKISGISFSLI